MPINKIKDLFVRPYKRQGRSEFEESDRSYLDKELQNIEETAQDLSDAAVQIADNAPENPRRGMIRIAISPWNPGSGTDRGYFYDGTAWTVLDEFALADAAAAQAAVDDVEAALDDPSTGYNAGGTYLSTAQAEIAAIESALDDPSTGYNAGATALSTMQTSISNNAGSIGTNATAITALETTVNHGSTGVAANASAIGTLETTVNVTNAGAISANSSAINALETTVNDGSTGVAANASAIGTLETTVNVTQAGAISTNASAITNLETTVNHGSTGVAANASAIGTLETTVNVTQAGLISANAADITTLEASVSSGLVNEFINSENASIPWGASTGVTTHSTAGTPKSGTYHARVDENLAQWGALWNADNAATDAGDGWPNPKDGETWTIGLWYKNTDTSPKTFGIPGAGGRPLDLVLAGSTSTWTWVTATGTLNGAITGPRFTMRTASLAAGKVIDIDGITLVRGSHVLDGTEVLGLGGYARATRSLVVGVNSVTGIAEASYGLDLDVNGHISGFSSTNNGATSTFAIVADKFQITEGATNGGAPFEVDGGVTYIKDANIKELTLSKLLAGAMGVSMELGASGNIRMGSTAYDTGNGIFLGNVSGVYKMSIKNDEHYLRFNGTNIEASGDFLNRRSTSANAYTSQHIVAENTETAQQDGTVYVLMKNIHLTRAGDVRIGLEIKNEAASPHGLLPGYRIEQDGNILLANQNHEGGNTYVWYRHVLTDIDPDAGPLEVWVSGGFKSGDNKWSRLRGTIIYTDKPMVDYITPTSAVYPEITY